MATPIIYPQRHVVVEPEPLTAAAFAPFGTVISPAISASTTQHPLLSSAVPPLPSRTESRTTFTSANQGTALKISPVSPLLNQYPIDTHNGSHTRTAHGLMSIFSCFPRLNTYHVKMADSKQHHRLKVGILERHPFTTQTFCPMGASQPAPETISDHTYILILVAPTVQDSNSHPPNPPDLDHTRAFIATAPVPGQSGVAVTYAPGTWHAPMIILGSRRVDFLVTQFANGCIDDDCQEVLIGEGPDQPMLDSQTRAKRMDGSARHLIEVDLSSLHLANCRTHSERIDKL